MMPDVIRIQYDAFKAGSSIIDALKFNNEIQLEALRRGVPAEDALKFSDYAQIVALEVSTSVEDALYSVPESTGGLSLLGEVMPVENSSL